MVVRVITKIAKLQQLFLPISLYRSRDVNSMSLMCHFDIVNTIQLAIAIDLYVTTKLLLHIGLCTQ